jgi:hypothetical protein
MKWMDEVGIVGNEHDSMSSECETEGGNCEDAEAETDEKNGEQIGNGEGE